MPGPTADVGRVFNEAQILNQLVGMEGVEFDARKYGWLGTVQKAATACTIRSDSPFNTADDLPRRDLPTLILGSTAPGSASDDMPKLMASVPGANVRVVSGYAGTAPIRLAVESGELHGLCWSWDSVVATAKHWLDTDYAKVPVYHAAEGDTRVTDRFPNARRIDDLARDPQSKQLINAGMAAGSISKPFVAPPGMPADRLKALQEAFMATMADLGFLADAEQARLDIAPNSGEKSLQIVTEILALTPDLTKRLVDIRK